MQSSPEPAWGRIVFITPELYGKGKPSQHVVSCVLNPFTTTPRTRRSNPSAMLLQLRNAHSFAGAAKFNIVSDVIPECLHVRDGVDDHRRIFIVGCREDDVPQAKHSQKEWFDQHVIFDPI